MLGSAAAVRMVEGVKSVTWVDGEPIVSSLALHDDKHLVGG
jgi:hypothetical protein